MGLQLTRLTVSQILQNSARSINIIVIRLASVWHVLWGASLVLWITAAEFNVQVVDLHTAYSLIFFKTATVKETQSLQNALIVSIKYHKYAA